MSKAILVAGMHRSGTSATTGALRMCGVSLGSDLVPAAADNRLGYWENARAVAVHEQLLERLQRSWDDVRSLPHGWLESEAARDAAEQIEALVHHEFAGEPLWAVKDPRICRFLPLWKQVLNRIGIPVVVLMVARRPSEVAASIQKRNGWLPALGELLWQRHVFEAERHSRDLRRCVVTYDEMLANPRATMTRALDRLGIMSTSQKVSVVDSLERFINGDERHHCHDSSDVSSDTAAQAFGILSSIAMNNEGWSELSALSDAFEESASRDYRYVDALAESAWRLRNRVKESGEVIAEVRSQLNAQIAWSNQAVQREQELQADLARAREDLNAQIQWSNEAVERQQRLQEELALTHSSLMGQIQWADKAVERLQNLERELHARSDKLTLAESTNVCLRDELATAREELASARGELASILSSLSWKATTPIRAIARLVSAKSTHGFNGR